VVETQLGKFNAKYRHLNPEEVNHQNHPSKILLNTYKGYSKTIDGIKILELTNFATILERCPRFNQWYCELVKTIQNNA